MCFGGGGGGGGPQRTEDQTRQDRLVVEAMKIRQAFLPYLAQAFGYQYTPGSDIDTPGTMTALQKTPQRQGLESLAFTGMDMANQGAQTMQSRMDMANSLLPGLARSVQASVAPGNRVPWTIPATQARPAPFARTLPTGTVASPPNASTASSTDPQAFADAILKLLQSRLPPPGENPAFFNYNG